MSRYTDFFRFNCRPTLSTCKLFKFLLSEIEIPDQSGFVVLLQYRHLKFGKMVITIAKGLQNMSKCAQIDPKHAGTEKRLKIFHTVSEEVKKTEEITSNMHCSLHAAAPVF